MSEYTAKKDERAVVEYKSRDGQQIKLSPSIIKNFLVSGKSELVTNQELFMYMGVCKSRGLNPFIKDAYLIKYTPNDPAAIIVSIDYYRKRAKAQPDCEGWKTGIILKNSDQKLEYREGCILLDNEDLLGAWFEAKPCHWKIPMRKEINLKRYIKKRKDGRTTRFWSEENQPEQIAKVAESQGLRATWPDEFQGLYVDAEIQSMEAQGQLDNQIAKAAQTNQEDTTPDPKKAVNEKLNRLKKNGQISKEPEMTQEQADEHLKALHKIQQRLGSRLDAESFSNWMIKEKGSPDVIAVADLKNQFFVPCRDEYIQHLKAIKPDYTAKNSEEQSETTDHGYDATTSWEQWADMWRNKRRGKPLQKTGFYGFVHDDLQGFMDAPSEIKQEAASKWLKFYPNIACPFMHKAKPAEPELSETTVSPESDPEALGALDIDIETEAREHELGEALMQEAAQFYDESKAKALVEWIPEFASKMGLTRIEALKQAVERFPSYEKEYTASLEDKETNGVPTTGASVEDVRKARNQLRQLKQENPKRLQTAINNLYNNRKKLIAEMTIQECDAISEEWYELRQLEEEKF
jgi:phage recombination protein Bet